MYFSKLPKIRYNYMDSENNIRNKIAIDITSRVKVAEYVNLYKNNFNEYTIRDSERPDTLAHKLYERSDLHWVFYIVNGMINPYESWPRSSIELTREISEKYQGTSFFVPDVWLTRLNDDEEYFYSVVYSALDGINNPNDGFEKIVLPTNILFRIALSKKVKVYINGTMYEVEVKKVNSEFYEVRTETKAWPKNPSITEAYMFYEVENFGSPLTIRVPITRIIQLGKYAPHHFEVNGETRDPFQSFADGILPYEENPYNHFIQPLTDDFLSNGNFMNPQKDTFASVFAILGDDGKYLDSRYYKTNETYELELNEEKRKIMVPKPTLVQQVVSSLEEIFR